MVQAKQFDNQQKYHRCENCQSFQDFNEANARGWCQTFNIAVRKPHQATDDCRHNGAVFKDPYDPEWELNLPRSPFAVGDHVKLIDKDKPHTQWQTFRVIDYRHNHRLHRSLDSYLEEAEWYYEIANFKEPNNAPIHVKDNDICLASQAHLISTEKIF